MKFTLIILTLISVSFSCEKSLQTKTTQSPLEFSSEVPISGNSWVINEKGSSQKIITKQGLENWTNKELKINTYVKLTQTGELYIGLKGNVASGVSKLKISIANQSETITLNNLEAKEIEIGSFKINEPGYKAIQIEALEFSGNTIAEISDILIGGSAAAEKVYYVKDDFYWGRRGPSVHLSYQMPENKDIQYFYNEINVPKGEDIIGSYYMANGFAEGYFGIQVNSATERRVLFSVWSPFKTDNPNDIPEEERIILLKKGKGVTTGKFGNEGSGGQSYFVYPWQAGSTYKFLLKGEPSENNSTDYTAYFFSPEENTWQLIASFRRPKTNTYLKRFHSFLENFTPNTGYISRKANYQNQWVYSKDGEWIELTKARFTADATARKEARMDYSGGKEGNKFFMKNCGFFNETTEINSSFERQPSGQKPIINLSKLE